MRSINKKGQSRAMGIAMVVMFVAVIGGIVFGSDGLANTNLTGNAPAWVVTLLTLGVGFTLVRLVTRSA